MAGDVWFAKHADFLSDPAIAELGERHGPGGPLAIDALLGLAKLARKGGIVTIGYTALARRSFLTGADQARAILRDSAEFGVIEIDQEDALQCVVSFPRWAKWQDAFRLQRHRDKTPGGTVAPALQTVAPALHDRSAAVARRPLTVDRDTSSLRSEVVEPRLDAAANVSDLFAYWQQQCGHTHAKLTADRRAKVMARLREGYTVEQVRAAIDGAAKGAHVDDATGRRFDDLELICRTGSKLESFIERTGTTGALSSAEFVKAHNAASGINWSDVPPKYRPAGVEGAPA